MDTHPLSHKRPSKLDRFWFGAPYYPEHWTAEERRNDAQWMQEAGFNLVRMAEFAWDRMEPTEGVFEFGFFDEVIAELGAQGIQTLLCTPTATPPRWLTRKHPDMLRVDANGKRMEHGSRQHACYTHPAFREHSRRITRAMAKHYRDNPNVVGWQTDNEFHCLFSETYTASAERMFQAFLAKHYRFDIQSLNQAWGTAFWSQSYLGFEDIPLPKPNHPWPPNPGHWLDYKRFLSHAITCFQREQINILRATNPKWWILHNGIFGDIDYRGAFGEDLDILGYDYYPMFEVDPRTRKDSGAFNLDRARALCGNFFIPEHQTSGGGQNPFYTPGPEPGETRLISYQSIAHGADSLMYFRWRSCRVGAEQYWNGIIGHDNVRRRHYREIQQTGQEMRKLEPELLGSHVHIDCAVASGDLDVSAGGEAMRLGMRPESHYAEQAHQWLHRHGYQVGCVHPQDDLSDLKLYIIPHWTVFDPQWTPALKTWVEAGGTLVVGARTATRDLNNRVISETPPGCLRELCGVKVVESGRAPAGGRSFGIEANGEELETVEDYYEKIEVDKGVEVLGTWTDRFLAGSPFMTLRTTGKGHVIYIAGHLSGSVLNLCLPSALDASHCKPLRSTDNEWVEIVERRKRDARLWFVLNHHAQQSFSVKLPAGVDLLAGTCIQEGEQDLEPFGVRVLRLASDR
ncbi:MAG: beta-galactosidase [Opitutales bacterium]|nr:beta-galactosidase [Opitutales bacterium]